MSAPAYDKMGVGYREIRKPDPRIAAAIDQALGSARSVLNVGAGTGSYEPPDRAVTAVEPSSLMIEQRPPSTAPVVQGQAEQLPFAENSFDAVMAVLTIHHWQDLRAGLEESIRVARDRLVLVTVDSEAMTDLWLVRDYFPEAISDHAERMPSINQLRDLLPSPVIEKVPIPARCTDQFFIALWDRPEACLDPRVRRASSVWHQMPAAAVERGLTALAQDLESGRWEHEYGQLRGLDQLDVGLRLVVADVSAPHGLSG